MPYASSNDLSDFEFHDSISKLERYEQGILSITVQNLIILASAESNPHSTDMEIKTALITFNGFRAISFEPGQAWQIGETGLYPSHEPKVVFEGSSAEKLFLAQLQAGVLVYEFGLLENGNHYLDGSATEPWFQLQFTFDSVTIQWDSFYGPAWYEVP